MKKLRLFTVLAISLLLLAAAAPPAIMRSAAADIIVYVTNTGRKYHRSGCGSLWNSCIPLSLQTAKSRGYAPCMRCRPPY